jgi:predicted flap endonuclease-1-like 5' DNA nuclease
VLVRLGLVGTSRGMPVYAGLEREPGGAVLANVADQPGGPDPEGDVPATTTDDGTGAEAGGLGLPVSKLRGLAPRVRAALKRHRVTTCGQLLRAAGGARDRDRLAREAGIDPDALLALVRQADLARVAGIGTVFGLMLEDLGVADVAALAARDPAELHARLRRYNGEERLARRSPTPGEVESWVAQARSLPVLVSY